jgi:hypothetical protein
MATTDLQNTTVTENEKIEQSTILTKHDKIDK